MQPIITTADLRSYALQLAEANQGTTRSLEEYLLALLHQIQAAQGRQPSYQDFAIFLQSSYNGELVKFSEDWKDLPKETTEINSEAYHQEIRTFECQERRLKIRIYGLHELNARGDLDKDPKRLWLNGAVDFRGSKWYNFDVGSFVERGTAWLEAYEPDEEEYNRSDGWVDFGTIVTDGAVYE